MIRFTYRFNWHPSQINELTLFEFDAYATQIERWEAQEEADARKAEAQR